MRKSRPTSQCMRSTRTPPDRRFFYGILGTLSPLYVSGLIKHANRERNKPEGEVPQEDTIEVSEAIFKKLEAEPFFSCKCPF